MNALRTRRSATEFARLVDGGVAGPDAATLREVEVASHLRALGAQRAAGSAPSPEFQAALRTRLVAVATVGPARSASAAPARPAARPRALPRRTGLLAGGLASVVALTGIGVAGTHSLPGQVFYGLKTTSESVRLDLASGDLARGRLHLEFAGTRLREVRALAVGQSALALGSDPTAAGRAVSAARARAIRQTLREMDVQTRSGQWLLQREWTRTGASAPLHVMVDFAARQSAALRTLLPLLPADSQRSARTSLGLLTRMRAAASRLLGMGTACGPACRTSTGASMAPSPGAPGSSGGDCRCLPGAPSQRATTVPPTGSTSAPGGQTAPPLAPTAPPLAPTAPPLATDPAGPLPPLATPPGPVLPGATAPAVTPGVLPSVLPLPGVSLSPPTVPLLS